MIKTWVFLLGIFATALICFGGGFAFGIFRGLKELQKDLNDIEKKKKENSDEVKREMCKKSVKSGVCPKDCDRCAWNTLKW